MKLEKQVAKIVQPENGQMPEELQHVPIVVRLEDIAQEMEGIPFAAPVLIVLQDQLIVIINVLRCFIQQVVLHLVRLALQVKRAVKDKGQFVLPVVMPATIAPETAGLLLVQQEHMLPEAQLPVQLARPENGPV